MASKEEYRSILLKKLDLDAGGFRIRELALHRHIEETSRVRPHHHRFHQILLYLSGQGWQLIEGERSVVYPGTLVGLPAGVEHSFRRGGQRRPMCLVIDFESGESSGYEPVVRRLSAADLGKLRRIIAKTGRIHAGEASKQSLLLCAAVLELFAHLLRSAGWYERDREDPGSALQRRLEKFFQDRAQRRLPLREIAKRMGFHQDYLNRLLKEQTGLTLKMIRDEWDLREAQKMLSGVKSVSQISMELQFEDPNYFSRWFKKQTGYRPTQWRAFFK